MNQQSEYKSFNEEVSDFKNSTLRNLSIINVRDI